MYVGVTQVYILCHLYRLGTKMSNDETTLSFFEKITIITYNMFTPNRSYFCLFYKNLRSFLSFGMFLFEIGMNDT